MQTALKNVCTTICTCLHCTRLRADVRGRSFCYAEAGFLLWEGGFSVGRTSLPLALYCFFSVAQPVCAAADTSRLKVQTNVMRADNGAYYLHHCLHALLIDNYCCPIRRKHTNGLKHQTQPLMGARRPEAAEKYPTRDASPPLERNALAQQSFTWFLICFLICKSDRKRYH